MFAPLLMIALAVLVKGYAQTGDGFAAGVIAGLGVALQYVALGRQEVEARLPVRAAVPTALAGLALALLVAAWGPLRGDALLTHVPPPGAEVVRVGTVELITAVAFDVGVFLLVLGTVVGAVQAIAGGRS
jgi:multisubunit Na+/H+ antiporter MnhB subunit